MTKLKNGLSKGQGGWTAGCGQIGPAGTPQAADGPSDL